jgi:hypothetical protein
LNEEDDATKGESDEGHRRDLSRFFLAYLRSTARRRVEYRQALHQLAQASQIQRHWAEDDLEQDLEYAIDFLLEKYPDPRTVEGEINEADAAQILESQGAFEPTPEESEEKAKALALKLEEIARQAEARSEERKGTIWQQSFRVRERALAALRSSGFVGPAFEADWNDPSARISFSVGNSRQFLSSGLQVGSFSSAEDAARRILGTAAFVSPVAIVHSEEPRVTLERI